MAKKSRSTTPGKTGRRKSPVARDSRSRTAIPPPDPIDVTVETTARALGLKIDPAWLPAICAHLQVTLRLGAMVTAFRLADDAEPGPVFQA